MINNPKPFRCLELENQLISLSDYTSQNATSGRSEKHCTYYVVAALVLAVCFDIHGLSAHQEGFSEWLISAKLRWY
ncbi:hypothetical protein JOB18_026329 [Solea senegalensis]|uniref:Uncharacterized protein n=1 Tax=Solea senegalensis TaxID=28829 RepID=A0AAV6PM25_SOLSE|nr:hypothetical protein JOB18_026329 [Solea senegalensis]